MDIETLCPSGLECFNAIPKKDGKTPPRWKKDIIGEVRMTGESALHEEPRTTEFRCTARGTQVKESICGVLKPSIPVGCLKSNVGYCRGKKTAFAAVTLSAFLCSCV